MDELHTLKTYLLSNTKSKLGHPLPVIAKIDLNTTIKHVIYLESFLFPNPQINNNPYRYRN